MDTIFSDPNLADRFLGGQGPKYKQLVEGLTQAISHGDVPERAKLPPVRDLAWALKITPGTVARAYTILSSEGWVATEVGRGTFVRPAAERAARVQSVTPMKHLPMGQTAALLQKVEKERGGAFLYAPRLPDVGQVSIIREAMMAASTLPDLSLLNYPHFSVQAPLRQIIHSEMRAEERAAIDPTCIVMTNGGQNGIMLAMQTLLSLGAGTVLVEQHSYPGLRRAVELLGGRVVAVPMDQDGIDPDALERIARAENARLLFTMPEAHNPTCTVTSNARREQIAAVARRIGLHLVQDDCYRVGVPHGPTYRRLLPEQSWYISSLSKTVSPALRAGYVITPKGWSKKLRRVVDVNYYGVSMPMAEIVYQVLAHPDMPQVIANMRQMVRDYVEVAVNVLGRFDLGWSHDVPFLWLHLPSGWRASAFVQAAEARGIRVRPGEDFSPREGPSVHAVRLSVNGQMSLDRFRAVLVEIGEMLDNPPESISA
ncbi:PLP-dependent aminotransferase family protein [Aliiroseovarius lamellibrachiae]|uniref:aminotransferase-like domain-containing protein n=1 Tax=Aliiroseovarius lamellibrachiae TaxID=1924933 RepID=UPI001BDFFA97|nr:PLP-dependent aminotransferase family protein [Aliiroseovarius lamellibrachiae]MBT2131988.1 PLP-dependent aminotransferase family protein [Aliiroseovarius lamellibrachiae]